MASITILQPNPFRYHLYKIVGCCSSGNLNKIIKWNFEPNPDVSGRILAIYNTSHEGNALEYALIKAHPDVFDCDGKLNGTLTFTVQCWTPCAYQRVFFNQPLDIVQIGGFAGTVISKNKHQLGRIRNAARGNYHSWRYDESGTYLTNEVGVDVPIGTKLTFQVMGGWGQTRYVWLGHKKSLNLHLSEDFASTDFNNVLANDTTRRRADDTKPQLPSEKKTFYPDQLKDESGRPINSGYGSLTLVEKINYAPELTTIQPDMLKLVGGFTVDRFFAKELSKKERDSIEVWESSKNYEPGDLVKKLNQIWFCLSANVDKNPLKWNRAEEGYINNNLDPFDPVDYWVQADHIFNTPHKFTVHAKDLGATCLYVSDSQGCTIQYVINVVASHCTKWSTIEGASSNSNEYTVGTTRNNLPKNRVAPLTNLNNSANPIGGFGIFFDKNNDRSVGSWRKHAIDRTNVVPINEDWITAKYYYDNGTEETQSHHFSWCDCDSVIDDRKVDFFEEGTDNDHPHSIATFNDAEHMFFNGWGFYSNSGSQQGNLIENAIPEIDDNSTFIYCDRWRDRNDIQQYEDSQDGLIQNTIELPAYTPRCLTDSQGNTPTTQLAKPDGLLTNLNAQQGDPSVLYAGFGEDIEYILPPWFLYDDLGDRVKWSVSVVERSDTAPNSPIAAIDGAGWAQDDDGGLHVGPWTSKKNSDKAIISVRKNNSRDGFYLKSAGVTNYLPAMIRVSREIPSTNGISKKGHLYSLFPMAGPRQPREIIVNNDDPDSPNQNSQQNQGANSRQHRTLLSRRLFFGGVTSLNTRRIPIDGATATINDSCVPWTNSDLFARVMVLSPAVSVGVGNMNLDGSEFMAPQLAQVAGPDSNNKHSRYRRQSQFNRDVYPKLFKPNLEIDNPQFDIDNLRNQLLLERGVDNTPERTIIDFGPLSENKNRKFRIYFNFHKGQAALGSDDSFNPSGHPYVYVAAYPVDQHANQNNGIFSDSNNFLKNPGHQVPKRCNNSNTYYVELELNNTKSVTTALGFIQLFIEFKPDIKSRITNNHPYFQTAARNSMKIEADDDWFFHKGIQEFDNAVFLPYHLPKNPKEFCGGDDYYADKVTEQGGLYTQLRGTEPIIPAFVEYMQHSPLVWDPQKQIPAILNWGKNGNLQQKIFAVNALGRFEPNDPINPDHPFMFNCPFKINVDGTVNWISDLYNNLDTPNKTHDPFWKGNGQTPFI